MKIIFIEGTAGAGKSLLAAKLKEHYTTNGAFASVLNMDPGVEELPYACDIDVRDMVNVPDVMRDYNLGPNGAVIAANDIVASRISLLQKEVDSVNPDYLIVDTPGQIELFAYRVSGPLIVQEMSADQKASIFLYDGALVSSPTNFVSITLLAASIQLRLGIPAINIITKIDLMGDELQNVLEWSNANALESSISQQSRGEMYSLSTDVLRGLDIGGFVGELIPVSNVTGEGMPTLEAALSRIVNLGEEVED